MAEFQVGEHTYRSGKLNARQQLHVVRRLGPILGPLMQLSLMRRPDVDAPDAATAEVEAQMAIAIPFLDSLAKMSDEDINYIINACMSITQRQQGGNGSGPATWVQCWNSSAQREMFDDIDMGALLQITWNVVQDNLGGFLPTRPAPSVAQDMPQRTAGFAG